MVNRRRFLAAVAAAPFVAPLLPSVLPVLPVLQAEQTEHWLTMVITTSGDSYEAYLPVRSHYDIEWFRYEERADTGEALGEVSIRGLGKFPLWKVR